MDYRERRYYLARLDGIRHNGCISIIKNNIPSIKIHTSYNHFKANIDKCGYDGRLKNIGYVQIMISCRKEYINQFEYLMRKIKENDDYVVLKEITKGECGQ